MFRSIPKILTAQNKSPKIVKLNLSLITSWLNTQHYRAVSFTRDIDRRNERESLTLADK